MALAFSPDGQTVLTECLGQTTHRWDATTGLPIGPPMDHPGFYAIAFSPDRKTALTGRSMIVGRCRCGTLRSNRPIGKPMEHQGLFRACRVQPRWPGPSSYSSVQRTMLTQLWDANTRRPLGEPMEYRGIVGILTFSPDGETFLREVTVTRHVAGMRPPASPSAPLWCIWGPRVERGIQPRWQDHPHRRSDRTARLWDLASGRPLGEPMPHRGEVSAVAFSPDGRTVLTGSATRRKALGCRERPAARQAAGIAPR